MECQAVKEQMSAWLDQELDADAEAVLTAHLEGCEACRSEWRKLRALDAALGNLAAPVPRGLAEKVAAQVRRPRPRRQGWQSAALAACLVLGIALGGTVARSFYGADRDQRGRGGSGQPGGFPRLPPGVPGRGGGLLSTR